MPATPQKKEEAVIRAALSRMADDLGLIHYVLKGVHASLPVSAREEIMLLGEEDLDFPTEARAVIECVLNDWIGPAIRDLKSLVGYRARGGERGS